jgi:hypothetical protein
MTLPKPCLLMVTLGTIAGLLACGGSNSSTPSTSVAPTPPANPPAISVSLSAAPTSLFVSSTTPITATVVNDSKNGGVIWSCAPANTCGTFSMPSSASGAAISYMAPTTVPSGAVIITATSVTDTTKSASTSPIAINPATQISVTLTTPPPSSLTNGASTNIAATVTGDSANAGVNWSCTPASTCGSFLATHTASAATTVYTAPIAVPNGNSVTIIATSMTDNTKSASANVTIVSSGSPAPLANGTYVFSLAGQHAIGGYLNYVVGAFTLSDGIITAGEQDFIDYYNPSILTDAITGGSVATTIDGNLQITIDTADTVVGVDGTETINATLVSTTKALINEFDQSATASGELDLQTSTAPLCATPPCGYAFYLNGGDSITNPAAIGGVMTITGLGTTAGSGTISGAGSVLDFNDLGTVLQNQPFSPSTVSAPDSFGRAQFSLIINSSEIAGIGLIGYTVDGNRIPLIENDNDPNDIFSGVTSGSAFAQGSNTGTFTAASIEGTSFVFATNGQDLNNYFQAAGVLTANADGTTVSGTLNANDLTGTGAQAPIPFTGTYAVDSTGRVTLSGLTDRFISTAQIYLSGGSQASLVTMDLTDAAAGYIFQQTGSSFTSNSFSGNYAFNATGYGLPITLAPIEFDAVGPITADGIGGITGNVDENILASIQGASPASSVPLIGTFTANADGIFIGTISGLDITKATNQDSFIYYLIDATKGVAIETDPNQLTLGYFELQQ